MPSPRTGTRLSRSTGASSRCSYGWGRIAFHKDALNSIAAEMKIGRSDLIQIVLREWLETHAYLPVRESETDGSA